MENFCLSEFSILTNWVAEARPLQLSSGMEIIRREEQADSEGVRAVHLACFPTEGEANLVDALRNEGLAAVSLVAVMGKEVTGHILFSPVTVDGRTDVNVKGAGLGPVAVLPSFQNKSIGSRLIREGLKEAETAGFDFIVCLGGPKYYGRFGFTPASTYGLGNEYGVDSEFMVVELNAGALRDIQGIVKYAKPFQDLT